MVKKYCAYYIKQINDYVAKRANNELREYDLTLAQHTVLMILYGSPEKRASMKSLEHELAVAQSTTAGIVERLSQKGLVVKLDSAEDRRIKFVQITPQGIQACEKTNLDVEAGEDFLFGCLTGQERKTLQELLKKVCKNIE